MDAHHCGVRVGADHRVRVEEPARATVEHAARQVLDVDLGTTTPHAHMSLSVGEMHPTFPAVRTSMHTVPVVTPHSSVVVRRFMWEAWGNMLGWCCGNVYFTWWTGGGDVETNGAPRTLPARPLHAPCTRPPRGVAVRLITWWMIPVPGGTTVRFSNACEAHLKSANLGRRGRSTRVGEQVTGNRTGNRAVRQRWVSSGQAGAG